MSRYVIIDGVLQMSTPSTERWARRVVTHVPGGRLLGEATESPLPEVRQPELRAEERATRTTTSIINSLDETEE